MSKFKYPKETGTQNKTIRFPDDVVDAVNKVVEENGSNFSAFVIAAVRFALDDLEEQTKNEKNEA